MIMVNFVQKSNFSAVCSCWRGGGYGVKSSEICFQLNICIFFPLYLMTLPIPFCINCAESMCTSVGLSSSKAVTFLCRRLWKLSLCCFYDSALGGMKVPGLSMFTVRLEVRKGRKTKGPNKISDSL